jgi:hypothetical protein
MHLSNNPLITRTDLQRLVRDLFDPLVTHFSPGRARVQLGETGAIFSSREAELEGFARPLWALAPLAAGGGAFDHWDFYQQGLTNGANPEHPEYWGNDEGNARQMHVEMAALGLALALVPDEVWTPLCAEAQRNLASWLGQIYNAPLWPNNWQFFRVLVHLGLKKVGAERDRAPVEASLQKLESYYLGDGWYGDGADGGRDYYIPFAMQFYALLYARLAERDDTERAARFRERAALFAQEFIHWFAADGAALPFGRSLTYRFACGAFWGALAFADVEALPWPVIKGLAMRHLRWWLRQPIFTDTGLLSIGYTYPNLNMAEQYNSPGSPYWALKFFLPLALPDEHPFWIAEEAPLPESGAISVQKQPGFVVCRDEPAEHVFALAHAQSGTWLRPANWLRHGSAKYCKFAYSTLFGLSVPGGSDGLQFGAFDSMLALSDGGDYWRVRDGSVEQSLEGQVLYSRWESWPDVKIETWLLPDLPWHVRVHRLTTERKLHAAEGGFAAPGSDDVLLAGGSSEAQVGFAKTIAPPCAVGIRDLFGKRKGAIILPLPNTNLLFPKSSLPTLISKHEPGEHWLICAVLGTATLSSFNESWDCAPAARKNAAQLEILSHADGSLLLSLDT